MNAKEKYPVYAISEFQVEEPKLPTWHRTFDVKFQAKIPCKLSQQQLHERAIALSSECHKLTKKSQEKKDTASELAAQIKMIETEITRLANIIEKGIEDQERPVMWIRDFDAQMKQLVLVDENLIVGETTLSSNEMQAALKLEADEVPVEKTEAAE
jgi:septal ring factor EnvC (AmiA/AmiB activator)